MKYKVLYILIEGDDDERFFQRIITPMFEAKYDSVRLWKYAQQTKRKFDSFLRSIKAMEAEYLYATDINLAPCVTAKKEKIQDKFNDIDKDKIIVVIKEIESWYLAGLDAENSKNLGVYPLSSVSNLIKEQFDDSIPKRFESRIDFMQEILKYFQIEIAKQKNKSFRYFLDKHDCD